MKKRDKQIEWEKATNEMHAYGYTIVPSILSAEECNFLQQQYDNQSLYRKTIVMERYRFGMGEYKYFKYPLPEIVQSIRESFYPKLAPIANLWMEVLKTGITFPADFSDFQSLCHRSNQILPTPLILRYEKNGFNTLHQDLYGDIYFPIQLVTFLSEPERDYEGGEFILIEQQPRAQSKAIVLKPKKGDVLIFTTTFRPVKGSKGYYRVNMKHGVSVVHKGSRYTLGIIFHDAK